MPELMRHIEACHNAKLPGRRRRLLLGAAPVGWVLPDMAAEFLSRGARETPEGVAVESAAALDRIAGELVKAGRLWFRDEPFDVRSDADDSLVARIDRGALPVLGIRADGVHVNGTVRRADGLHVWIARRAAHKRLDPGKLDHVVAGGVPAGMSPEETLRKEAAEEASIPPELAARAVPVATISYAMERSEGLRRDRLYCYDLELPQDFTPLPADDEVERFELWPITRVLEAVRETDDFKFNVNLVLIDLFLRTGTIDPAGTEGRALRAGLDRN